MVAPDLPKKYPPYEPPDFANGTVKAVAKKTHCVDSGERWMAVEAVMNVFSDDIFLEC